MEKMKFMYEIFLKKITLIIIIIVIFITTTGCKLSGNPDIIKATAINDGRDLEIVWKKVENADSYDLYCDQVAVGSTKRNSYTIPGPWYYCDFFGCSKGGYTCNKIEVIAHPFLGGDIRKSSLNISPKSFRILDLASHDISENSWIKIDFSTSEIKVVSENEVDPSIPNTGWLIFFNNSGKPELRDIETTGKGSTNIVISFGRKNYFTPYLAPDSENYNKTITISSGDEIFFWADNKEKGYGSIDTNDYFGIIIVKSLIEGEDPSIYRGEGPYKVDLEIFIQDKVIGLRWIKY